MATTYMLFILHFNDNHDNVCMLLANYLTIIDYTFLVNYTIIVEDSYLYLKYEQKNSHCNEVIFTLMCK
jgi:hypothetical protein